jgi:hypothetical protein
MVGIWDADRSLDSVDGNAMQVLGNRRCKAQLRHTISNILAVLDLDCVGGHNGLNRFSSFTLEITVDLQRIFGSFLCCMVYFGSCEACFQCFVLLAELKKNCIGNVKPWRMTWQKHWGVDEQLRQLRPPRTEIAVKSYGL